MSLENMSLLFQYQEPTLGTGDLFNRANEIFSKFSHSLCQEAEHCIEQELQTIRGALGRPNKTAHSYNK